MRRALALVIPALVLGFATSALADKDKDKGRHGHGKGAKGQPVVVQPARFVIPDRDRVLIYRYYRSELVSVGHCPPGLARKGNGCLPPGQAPRPPKLWVVGAPLPSAVVYQPVPLPVVQQLAPVPDGYGYVRVDNDVLLMDMANRVVADVIGDLYDPYDPE